VPLSNPSIAIARRLCSERWVFACLGSCMVRTLMYPDLHQLL
jgi:hypothetical protein